MSAAPRYAAAGLDAPANTVGLAGLVPFAIQRPQPVALRRVPGVVRIWIDLPAGAGLDPDAPVAYRVFGGEAGLDFTHNGRIRKLHEVRMPIELPYRPRIFPAPPATGQMALEVSFWHRKDAGRGIQDVQWRQPVVWDPRGTNVIELRFALPD